MLRLNWKYPFLFVLMILLQIFIFNNIQVSGYISPQIYVFFILVLPLNIKGWLLLLLSFGLGLIIDAFSDSLAIHALASLFMAFCRPAVLRIFSGNTDPEDRSSPSYYNLGIFSLFFYSFILILIHHSTLFLLELFRLNEMIQTMSRSLISTVLTMLFVLVAYAFWGKSADEKPY